MKEWHDKAKEMLVCQSKVVNMKKKKKSIRDSETYHKSMIRILKLRWKITVRWMAGGNVKVVDLTGYREVNRKMCVRAHALLPALDGSLKHSYIANVAASTC